MTRILPTALTALALSTACVLGEPGQFSEHHWETLTGCRLIDGHWNDGDSFHVRHAGKEYIFRLYYVDTPEKREAGKQADWLKTRTRSQAKELGLKKSALYSIADVATVFSAERLKAAPFTVITRWEDAKGQSQLPRNYAVVETSQGDLAELLIANGLARIRGLHLDHPRGASAERYTAKLQQLEENAKSAHLGAWGVPEEDKRGTPAAKRVSKPAADTPAAKSWEKSKPEAAPKEEIPAF